MSASANPGSRTKVTLSVDGRTATVDSGTAATWPSFLGTYIIERMRKVCVRAAVTAKSPPTDERLDEVLGLLRRIAAELGIQ